MHMADPRVLNGRAIKIILIIHVEWPLLFASNAVVDVLQNKIWLNR